MFASGNKSDEVVERLKSDILSGKYAYGKSLPSVRALARRHGCSSATAQRALDELFHLGFVSRRQGRGTFVSRAGAARKVRTYDVFFPARYLMPMSFRPGSAPGFGIKAYDRDDLGPTAKQTLSNVTPALGDTMAVPHEFTTLLFCEQ